MFGEIRLGQAKINEGTCSYLQQRTTADALGRLAFFNTLITLTLLEIRGAPLQIFPFLAFVSLSSFPSHFPFATFLNPHSFPVVNHLPFSLPSSHPSTHPFFVFVDTRPDFASRRLASSRWVFSNPKTKNKQNTFFIATTFFILPFLYLLFYHCQSFSSPYQPPKIHTPSCQRAFSFFSQTSYKVLSGEFQFPASFPIPHSAPPPHPEHCTLDDGR